MGVLFVLKRIAFFIYDHWLTVLIAVALLVGTVFLYRACHRPPHLDEKAIQKAQDAIAKQDRQKMIEVLAESDTREAAIDSNIKQIEADREQAKKSYSDKSNADLAAELERRSHE